MKFSLSIVLDYEGLMKQDLITFDSLEKLDLYTSVFKNVKELRKVYEEKLDYYLNQNKNYLNNKKQNRGRICITCYDKQNNIRFFPIIYSENKDLLNFSKVLSIIKASLEDDHVLLEINKRKKYLLSMYEIDLLRLYFSTKDKKFKNLFKKTFYLRILGCENKYLYIRSLINVCNVFESYHKEKGNIESENIERDLEPSKSDFSLDEDTDMYLMKLVESEDYEQIFNYFGIADLESKSGNLIPIGIKKIKK